jgi:hypothetical protein
MNFSIQNPELGSNRAKGNFAAGRVEPAIAVDEGKMVDRCRAPPETGQARDLDIRNQTDGRNRDVHHAATFAISSRANKIATISRDEQN